MSNLITLRSKLNGRFLSRINHGIQKNKIQAKKSPIDYFCYFILNKNSTSKFAKSDESNEEDFIQLVADDGGYFYINASDNNILYCDSDGTDDGSIFQTLTLSTSNGESVIGLWSPAHRLYLGVSDEVQGTITPLGVRARAMGTTIIPLSCQFAMAEIDTIPPDNAHGGKV